MKITFLSQTLNMGGGTKILLTYAEILAKRGHEVLVVSVPEERVSFYEQIKFFVKHFKLKNNTSNSFSFFKNSLVKHIVIDKNRSVVDADLPDADVVIATWWETAEWLNELGDNKGRKLYFVQGHEVFKYLPLDRVMQTYHLPIQKIVVSKWLKDVMAREYGDYTSIVVHNSIDKSQFFAETRQKNNIPTVGFLYSSSYIKGVEITLQAISRLKQELPMLRVLSFGSHPPENRSDWDSSIEFHLLPEQHLIRDIYTECDVWLTASISEGFNLTAMEAMACGTPVISTKTGWPTEAIQSGLNGILIEINDIDGIVNGATWMLNLSEIEWELLSLNAQKVTESYSLECSVDAFESILSGKNTYVKG